MFTCNWRLGKKLAVGASLITVYLLVACAPQGSEPALLPTQMGTAIAPPTAVIQNQQATATPLSVVATIAPIPAPATLTPEPTRVIHVVKAGETLYRIAVTYNISIDDLVAANQINNPALLMVGDQLVIPFEEEETAVTPSTPSQIASPTATITPFPSSLIPPDSTAVNGIPITQLILIPDNVKANIREIYAYGQTIGRNPLAFSKLGDSTIMNPGLLVQFENGPYDLGPYAYLEPTTEQFSGSFDRYGAATHVGLHSWTALDPAWSDKTLCLPNENMVACEFHLNNPSYLIIRLGSNDKGVPDTFNRHTREIVAFAIQSGVIPILSAKADRFEGISNINNEILRQIAADYEIPLWDYDLVAETIPHRGLFTDNVHIARAGATYDYNDPDSLQVGQTLHDLTGLIALDAVWRAATE